MFAVRELGAAERDISVVMDHKNTLRLYFEKPRGRRYGRSGFIHHGVGKYHHCLCFADVALRNLAFPLFFKTKFAKIMRGRKRRRNFPSDIMTRIFVSLAWISRPTRRIMAKR